MASTFEKIVARVSSASDKSESVSATKKIVENNEKSKIEIIFAGSKSLAVNMRSPSTTVTIY